MKKNLRLISLIIRRKPGEAGLTLVELIIVVAILGIFMSSLFAVFKNSMDAWKKSEARLAVYQNARMALDQMTRDIQPAVFDPANGIYAKGYEKGSGIKPGSVADEFFFVSALSVIGTNKEKSDLVEIGYWIDDQNRLWRHYHIADEPEDFPLNFKTNPEDEYENEYEFGSNITDLQFKFHYRAETGWAVTDDANWDAEENNVANYSADSVAQNPDGLPNGVEIEITVVDPTEREEQKFSTMVYIPQAK